MPVNNPTHAHGQGYTDLNFMVPELATNIKFTKGTYYANQGDFASVGSVHPSYLNRIDAQINVTGGNSASSGCFPPGRCAPTTHERQDRCHPYSGDHARFTTSPGTGARAWGCTTF